MDIMRPENDIYTPIDTREGFEKDYTTKDFTHIKEYSEEFTIYASLDCLHSIRVTRMAKNLNLKYGIIYIDTFDPINIPAWLPGTPTIVSSSNVYCGRDCIDFLTKTHMNTFGKKSEVTYSNASPPVENTVCEDIDVSMNHNGAFDDIDASLMKKMSIRESIIEEALPEKETVEEASVEKETAEEPPVEKETEEEAQFEKETVVEESPVEKETEEEDSQIKEAEDKFRIEWQKNFIRECGEDRKEEIKKLIRQVLDEYDFDY